VSNSTDVHGVQLDTVKQENFRKSHITDIFVTGCFRESCHIFGKLFLYVEKMIKVACSVITQASPYHGSGLGREMYSLTHVCQSALSEWCSGKIDVRN
jgi:hypothetical protein